MYICVYKLINTKKKSNIMTITEEFQIVLKHLNPSTLSEAIALADQVARGYFLDSDVKSLFNLNNNNQDDKFTITEEFQIVLKHVNPSTLTEAIGFADQVAIGYFSDSDVKSLFNQMKIDKLI